MHAGRKFPAGAEVRQDGTVHFRVWAPERHRVAVRLERRLERGSDSATEMELTAEDGGYFAGTVPGAGVGARYHLMLDDDPQPYPDPVSRYQPEGPFGPSQIIDPGSFAWTDGDWRGVPPAGQVLYEMHIGTFTPEGTWAAAADQIPALADLGITVLELMPVNEFCGTFGWGYDGVNLFAPTRLYGTPDDLRRFVDRAHGHGVGVILDVVYNHLGPDGNFLKAFSKDYFTDRYKNE
jgi:maltooligosyltrehalose trehalohydrolase